MSVCKLLNKIVKNLAVTINCKQNEEEISCVSRSNFILDKVNKYMSTCRFCKFLNKFYIKNTTVLQK